MVWGFESLAVVEDKMGNHLTFKPLPQPTNQRKTELWGYVLSILVAKLATRPFL